MSIFPTVSIWQGTVTACEVGACSLPQGHSGPHASSFRGEVSPRKQHYFAGRLDRDCERCCCPTDHPVHLGPMHVWEHALRNIILLSQSSLGSDVALNAVGRIAEAALSDKGAILPAESSVETITITEGPTRPTCICAACGHRDVDHRQLDGHPIGCYCGCLGFTLATSGDMQPEAPAESEARTGKPVDVEAELERLTKLLVLAVDEADQSQRGSEPLLHKAAVMAMLSQAFSTRALFGDLREINDSVCELSNSLERIAKVLERWVP